MKSSLGDRMKCYEHVSDFYLPKKLPVIIRCDGRSFHSVTKKLPKPCFTFLNVMAETMKSVAENIDGCVFGYTQSDEMTFVLKNDQSLESQPWFDNRVFKIISIAAAEATYWFNYHWNNRKELQDVKLPKAVFDARVFVVPSETEMLNALLFRQQDCIKNAVSLAADTELKKKLGKKTALKLLHGKGRTERLQLLQEKCDIDFFTEYPLSFQRGVIAYKVAYEKDGAVRTKMKLDYDTPNFHEKQELILDAYACKAREEAKKSKEERNGK